MGDWGLPPIPNPQSPIPNPQSPNIIKKIFYNLFYKLALKRINIYIENNIQINKHI